MKKQGRLWLALAFGGSLVVGSVWAQEQPAAEAERNLRGAARTKPSAQSPSDELRRLWSTADQAFQEEDFESARQQFQQLLEAEPDGPLAQPARFRIAECYARSGRPHQAIPLYRQVAEAASVSPWYGADWPNLARLALAGLYREKGQLNEAARLYEQVLGSSRSNRLRATRGRAEVYVQQGQPERAIQLYRELAQQSAQYASVAHGEVGRILKEQGQYTEALVEYQQAYEQSRKRAGDESWLLGVAEAYDALDQPARATRTRQQIVRDWPGTQAAWQALWQLGDRAARKPWMQAQARRWFQRMLVEFGPWNPLAAPIRGYLLSGRDRMTFKLPHDLTILFDGGPRGHLFAMYGDWLLFLRRAGYLIHGKHQPLSPEVLSYYRVVILPAWRFTAEEFPTAPEQRALAAFVRGGGGLLVLTGSRPPEQEDLAAMKAMNSLTARFGMKQLPPPPTPPGRAGKGRVLESQRYTKVTDLTSHPALEDIPFFFLTQGAELTVSGKAQVLARCDGKPVLAAAEVGKGRVVVAALGCGLLQPAFILPPTPSGKPEWSEQNPKLLLNLVKWVGEKATVERKITIRQERRARE